MKQSDMNTSDENLARLLRLAGPRPEPSPEVTAEVYDSVHAAWARRARRQSRVRYVLQGAIAASLIAVVGVLLWPASVERPLTIAVGNVHQVAGTVSANVDGAWQLLQNGDELSTGMPLRTSTAAGLGLQLGNRTSVRLAADTHLVFETAQRLRLEQGRVYVDTADARFDAQYEVVTSIGVIRNLGTQFEVFSDDERTRVRVRGGEVVLDTTAESLHARRGEALLADRDGRIERSRFPSDDPQWQWAQELAPPFETNDSLVIDLVDWVARETGREVVFADARARNAAAATRISGSIDGLAPEQVMATALAATRLQAEIGGAQIVITRKEP